MIEKAEVIREIEEFVTGWIQGDEAMKNCFYELFSTVRDLKDVSLQFVARPGVSFSIRPKHENQKDRDLFAIIDVIDDNPEERWLSVCFYGDMITDTEERGEVIPGGLAGSDGYCFDIESQEDTTTEYVKARILEACKSASI